jgi:hypothetical protein
VLSTKNGFEPSSFCAFATPGSHLGVVKRRLRNPFSIPKPALDSVDLLTDIVKNIS